MTTKYWSRFLRSSALVLFALLISSSAASAAPLAPPHAFTPNLGIPGWSAWTSMGMPNGFVRAAMPSVGMTANGLLVLFVTPYLATTSGPGPDECGIYYRHQTAPAGGWTNWAQFGECSKIGTPYDTKIEPFVASNADGTLEVFAMTIYLDPLNQGTSRMDIVSRRQQSGSNADQWSAWAGLGSTPWALNLVSPVAAKDANDRLTVFAYGLDGNIWSTQQTAAGVDTWSNWQNLGAPPGAGQSPQVQQNVDGRLELFAWGSGGHIYNLWQTTPGGAWMGWGDLGKPALIGVGFAVGKNADGRLEVFVTDFSQLWHRWQWGFLGLWSDWASLGKPNGVNVDLPHVTQLRTGELLALAVGDDGALWAIQQKPTRDSWGAWFSFGKPATSFFTSQFDYDYTAVRRQGGLLSIFATADDGAVWRLDQQASVYLPLVRRP